MYKVLKSTEFIFKDSKQPHMYKFYLTDTEGKNLKVVTYSLK